MSVLPILRWPDPRLSQPCAPITPGPDAARLAEDMLATMYDAPGRGLAAPQVGHLLRLFVMDTDWKQGSPNPQMFLNPQIVWRSDTNATADEGCLSIPGVLAAVSRPVEVELTWQDNHGASHRAHFDGFAAACVQHEIDHLDGIVTFDRVPPTEREKLIADYEGAA